MHVSRIASVVQIPVLPPPFTVPFCFNCSPLHPATQASIPKVKEPSLILTLPFSQAICRFHGSPFRCSNLPTSCQFICLGDGNSPTLASHPHFPPAPPCSCKVHLILYIGLPKTASTAHTPCASDPCSSHAVHCLLHHHCYPPSPLVPLPQGLCTSFPRTISSPHCVWLCFISVSQEVRPDHPCLKYMPPPYPRHPITYHSILFLYCKYCKMIIIYSYIYYLSLVPDIRPRMVSPLSGWLPALYPMVRIVSGTKSMLSKRLLNE